MANLFSYTKSPTGSLSGASMAQQTEDAINSVANTAEIARTTVLEAESAIEAALNSAKNAQSAAEKGLIEIRQAASELSHLNIPSGDGHVGEFLGTNGTTLQWQGGMRYLGVVATLADLPSTTYTHGTLVSGNISEKALETLQEITQGGFNITVKGVLREITDLNFTGIEAISEAPSVINPKISAWGSCAYSETEREVSYTDVLYPWVTADASARVYVEDSTLLSTSKLFNADGSEYTGSAFTIANSGEGYVVMHGTESCVFTPSAQISIQRTEQETVRTLTFTTTDTGADATISIASAPTASADTDVSSTLQLTSGIATNGQKVESKTGDFYYVTAMRALYFWNGSAWMNLSATVAFTKLITLTADTAQGTAITIPNGAYVVGSGSLSVSYNGLKCYKDTNFSEIGSDGVTSSTFKLLFDAKKGDEIEVTIY